MTNLQITFRSVSESPAITDHIHKYFGKVNRIFKRINHCRVAIDIVQNHKHQGKLYSVSIDIVADGIEFASRKMNEDLYLAIRQAFLVMKKSLDKYAKRKRSHVERRSARGANDFSMPEEKKPAGTTTS